MDVAIGGRVDDDLDAFTAACGEPDGFSDMAGAILRADIDGRLGRGFACRDLVEFALVIA